jgi:hypothetical protein
MIFLPRRTRERTATLLSIRQGQLPGSHLPTMLVHLKGEVLETGLSALDYHTIGSLWPVLMRLGDPEIRSYIYAAGVPNQTA